MYKTVNIYARSLFFFVTIALQLFRTYVFIETVVHTWGAAIVVDNHFSRHLIANYEFSLKKKMLFLRFLCITNLYLGVFSYTHLSIWGFCGFLLAGPKENPAWLFSYFRINVGLLDGLAQKITAEMFCNFHQQHSIFLCNFVFHRRTHRLFNQMCTQID